MLNGRRISTNLETETFGHPLILLARTESTNDDARQLALKGLAEGATVVAEEQTAGRGRMGRRWLAPPATCLLASILFRPQITLSRIHVLTAVVALAAADAVLHVAGLEVALKWPNDLVLPATADASGHWRKVAGLLAEGALASDAATGQQSLEFAIVGIGINVNVPVSDLSSLAPSATSILAETGRETDREALLRQLLLGVERRMCALREGESPHDEWRARLVTLGSAVSALTAAGIQRGTAEDVDEDGALLLRTEDGILQRLTAADVTLLSPTSHDAGGEGNAATCNMKGHSQGRRML
jgi:BirA family transcriptional regulator, biotin operon repressor / biotin---[acetyl-CoA-carboxylase] ligase